MELFWVPTPAQLVAPLFATKTAKKFTTLQRIYIAVVLVPLLTLNTQQVKKTVVLPPPKKKRYAWSVNPTQHVVILQQQ